MGQMKSVATRIKDIESKFDIGNLDKIAEIESRYSPDLFTPGQKMTQGFEGGFKPNIHMVDKVPHIGYGFNLTSDPTRAQMSPDVLSGTRNLTELEGNQIFKQLYKTAEKDARDIFGDDFDKLPDGLKDRVIDMSYNMGGPSLKGFGEFKKAAVSGQYPRAAEEIKYRDTSTKAELTPYYEKTGQRAESHMKFLQDMAEKTRPASTAVSGVAPELERSIKSRFAGQPRTSGVTGTWEKPGMPLATTKTIFDVATGGLSTPFTRNETMGRAWELAHKPEKELNKIAYDTISKLESQIPEILRPVIFPTLIPRFGPTKELGKHERELQKKGFAHIASIPASPEAWALVFANVAVRLPVALKEEAGKDIINSLSKLVNRREQPFRIQGDVFDYLVQKTPLSKLRNLAKSLKNLPGFEPKIVGKPQLGYAKFAGQRAAALVPDIPANKLSLITKILKLSPGMEKATLAALPITQLQSMLDKAPTPTGEGKDIVSRMVDISKSEKAIDVVGDTTKDIPDLMEIENENLTLPQLKQKLEMAIEGKEDKWLVDVIKKDIATREGEGKVVSKGVATPVSKEEQDSFYDRWQAVNNKLQVGDEIWENGVKQGTVVTINKNKKGDLIVLESAITPGKVIASKRNKLSMTEGENVEIIRPTTPTGPKAGGMIHPQGPELRRQIRERNPNITEKELTGLSIQALRDILTNQAPRPKTGAEALAKIAGVPRFRGKAIPEVIAREGEILGPTEDVSVIEEPIPIDIKQPPELEKSLWDKMTPKAKREYIAGQEEALHPKRIAGETIKEKAERLRIFKGKAKIPEMPKGEFIYPEKRFTGKAKVVRAPAFVTTAPEAPKPKVAPPKEITLPKGIKADIIPSGTGEVISDGKDTDFSVRNKIAADMPFTLLGNKSEVISRMPEPLRKIITTNVENVYDMWGGSKGYRVGLFPNISAGKYNLNELSDERSNFYKNMQTSQTAQIVKNTANELIEEMQNVISEAAGISMEGRSLDEFLDAINAWLKKGDRARHETIRTKVQEMGNRVLKEALADKFASPESSGKYYWLANAKTGPSSMVDDKGNYSWTQGIIRTKKGVSKVKDVSKRLAYINRQLGQELIRDTGMKLTKENAWDVMERFVKDADKGEIDIAKTIVTVDPQYLNSATYSVGNEDAFWKGHKANLEKYFLPLVNTGVKIIYTNDADPNLMKWMQDHNLPFNIEKEIRAPAGRSGRDELISYTNFEFPKKEYVSRDVTGTEREVGLTKRGREEADIKGGRELPEKFRGKGTETIRVKIPVYDSIVEKQIDRLVKSKNLTPNQMRRLRKIFYDLDGPQFVDVIAGITPSSRPQKPPSIPRTQTITTKGFFDQKFKEPTIVRYITPQDTYIRCLGLQDVLGPSMQAKTKMTLERSKFFRAVDELEQDFLKFAKPSFVEKFKGAVSNIPLKAKEKLWDYLHVSKDKVDVAIPKEWRLYHDALRSITDSAIQRVNQIRVAYGEEPIRYLDGYIMHIKNAFKQKDIKAKYPIPPDVQYWLDKIHTKRVFNPTAMARTARTEEGMLKDPFLAAKAMMSADLKQVYLTGPNLLYKQKLEALSKAGVIPASTRQYAEAFMNIVIKGYPSKFDQMINKSLETIYLPQLMNFLLRPIGRTWSTSSINAIASGLGRIIHDSVIWGKIRLVTRNHTQKLLTLGLYPSENFVKGFLPENEELRNWIDTSDFYNISKSTFLEQLPKGTLSKLEQIGFAPYGHSHAGRIGGNVPFTMKVAYHAGMRLVNDPRYKNLGWTKDDVRKEMDYAANTCQYWYNLMGMPELYRHKTLAIFGKLQSWAMNYSMKYWREMLHRGFTGRTGWGKPIPPAWRFGALRHILASILFVEGMRRAFGLSYKQTALLGVLPAYLSPIGQVVLGLYQLATAKSDYQRASAKRTLKQSWRAFLPGSGAWKQVADVWTGKRPLKSLFFHTERVKTTSQKIRDVEKKFTGRSTTSKRIKEIEQRYGT